jgi:threonine/homoserine/homoserine lactone efflux protein
MHDVSGLLFIMASLVLIITPGQDMILVMSRSIAQGPSAGAPRSLCRLFLDGALSNVSNPKIAVFFFAFLPQFVLPGAVHPTLSVFVLGLLFAALTFLVKGPVGLGAGLLSAWLRERPAVLAWVYRGSGAVLVGLGLRLAFERRD